jgi:DNA repair protein RadC
MEKAIEYSLTCKKKPFSSMKIRCSHDAFKFARKFYHEDILIYESAFIILMNSASDVIGYAKISQGGVCGTLIDIRLVYKYALETLATQIIFVHNHPSGRLIPSSEDINISRKLEAGCDTLNIKFVDSLIISDDWYRSMKDEGDM